MRKHEKIWTGLHRSAPTRANLNRSDRSERRFEQICADPFKVVQICAQLRTSAQLCIDSYRSVTGCADLVRSAQVSPDIGGTCQFYADLQKSANVCNVAQICTSPRRPAHICTDLPRSLQVCAILVILRSASFADLRSSAQIWADLRNPAQI